MHMTYKASGVYMCSESFNKAANADTLLMLPSPHRPHFHPRSPHPWQRREKWRQTVFLLPGEILWDGPESCDPVPHRTHLPGVYTARSVFVLGCKHNEKKTCINMKNRLESPEASHPLRLNVYGRGMSIWPTLMCWNPHVSLTFLSTMRPSVCEVAPWALTLWSSDLFSPVVLKHLKLFSVQRREKTHRLFLSPSQSH